MKTAGNKQRKANAWYAGVPPAVFGTGYVFRSVTPRFHLPGYRAGLADFSRIPPNKTGKFYAVSPKCATFANGKERCAEYGTLALLC